MRLGTSDDVAITPLREYLYSRASNRRIGKPSEIDAETVASLTRGVEREGARLLLATDRDRINAGAQDVLAAYRTAGDSCCR